MEMLIILTESNQATQTLFKAAITEENLSQFFLNGNADYIN
jgi:hypothetical protein